MKKHLFLTNIQPQGNLSPTLPQSEISQKIHRNATASLSHQQTHQPPTCPKWLPELPKANLLRDLGLGMAPPAWTEMPSSPSSQCRKVSSTIHQSEAQSSSEPGSCKSDEVWKRDSWSQDDLPSPTGLVASTREAFKTPQCSPSDAGRIPDS